MIETPVAWVLGYKKRVEVMTVILASVMTNPVLNYLIALCRFFKLVNVDQAFVLTLEAIVVLVEWRILLYALGGGSRRHFRTSFIMNAASYLTGLLIF